MQALKDREGKRPKGGKKIAVASGLPVMIAADSMTLGGYVRC